jgi:catechol 2,3-dioxygenase-like lactoylglutathione lyase family enzyme
VERRPKSAISTQSICVQQEKYEMSNLNGVRAVIFPARDLQASIAAWTAVLGKAPAYQNPDFATFFDSSVEIGLSRLPWVDHPLVFWKVEDIEQAHRALLAAGARAMVEVAGGSMAEFGTAEVTNGDPTTGIVDVPGRRLAVLKAADGNLVGIMQDLPVAWS